MTNTLSIISAHEPKSEQRILFLDTEFTDLAKPSVLSLGIVCDDGREFYAELSGKSHLKGASEFVYDTVVTQFGLMPVRAKSKTELGRLVGEWLVALGEASLLVCYDYSADMDLLERALTDAGFWDRLKSVIVSQHVGYLIGEPVVERAMDVSWRASLAGNGIDRHHALADARALREGYVAMHGVGLSVVPCEAATECAEEATEPTTTDLTVEHVEWFQHEMTSLQRLRDDEGDDRDDAPEGTPILFLDIDDVICLSVPFGGYDAIEAINSRRSCPELVYQSLFHRSAVDQLRAVHEALHGRLRYVLTSTWRLHMNRTQLSEVFRRSGLAFICDNMERKSRWCTPSWPDRTRLDEIAEWLGKHGKGESFAVVDDTFSGFSLAEAAPSKLEPFNGRIVLCDEKVGLLPAHADRLIRILKKRPRPTGARNSVLS